MNVSIDRGGCISCGICEAICPHVFRMDDEGLAELLNPPRPEDEVGVGQAAADCPVAVIKIDQ